MKITKFQITKIVEAIVDKIPKFGYSEAIINFANASTDRINRGHIPPSPSGKWLIARISPSYTVYYWKGILPGTIGAQLFDNNQTKAISSVSIFKNEPEFFEWLKLMGAKYKSASQDTNTGNSPEDIVEHNERLLNRIVQKTCRDVIKSTEFWKSRSTEKKFNSISFETITALGDTVITIKFENKNNVLIWTAFVITKANKLRLDKRKREFTFFTNQSSYNLWVEELEQDAVQKNNDRIGKKNDKTALSKSLVPGTILYAHYSYNMIFANFYKVISIKGQTCQVRELEQKAVSGNMMRGRVVPILDKFKNNKILTGKISANAQVVIQTSGSLKDRAVIWDGEDKPVDHFD